MTSPALAATLEVGPGQRFAAPSAAAQVAADGDRIEIAAGQYADCAVWRANNLVIEGLGKTPADTMIRDVSCAGKGLFVIAGTNITVRNLTLANARVPDRNGAGIRAQGIDLTVERVHFINNEDGILADPHPDSHLTVRDSDFLRNGVCAADCAHGIYAGNLAELRVENSHFAGTIDGHHVKSRAARTEVRNCVIEDGAEGTASYLIDVPNGGTVSITDNVLRKGPKSENRTAAIMLGAEGVKHPEGPMEIARNHFTVEGPLAAFVVNRTPYPALLVGNVLGPGITPLQGPGSVR